MFAEDLCNQSQIQNDIRISKYQKIPCRNIVDFVSFLCLFANCLVEVEMMQNRMFPHFIVVEKSVYKSYGIGAAEKK